MTPPKTDWRSVSILILAGLVAACQVGKAAIAVPLLRQELGLSLLMASSVIGAYGMLGAVAGLPAGIGVSILGTRAALVLGLLAIAIGSGLGAAATGGASLLATRALEGCGFLAVVVAAPTLLRNLSAPRDRDVVLTCWSAYMPGGTAVMMLVGPLLTSFGWQQLWLANSVLAAGCAAIVWLSLPRHAQATEPQVGALGHVGLVFSSTGPILLALAFGTYTFQYFALTGLLPALLVERMSLTVAQAGAVSALAVVANTFGNLAAGIFLRLNVPLWGIMASAFACLALASFGIFSDGLPVSLVAAFACVSLGIAGLVPGSIFAATPRLAHHSAALAVALGLLVQASNLGQVLGPPALGAWVEKFGWSAAPFIFFAVGRPGSQSPYACVTCCAVERRIRRRRRGASRPDGAKTHCGGRAKSRRLLGLRLGGRGADAIFEFLGRRRPAHDRQPRGRACMQLERGHRLSDVCRRPERSQFSRRHAADFVHARPDRRFDRSAKPRS